MPIRKALVPVDGSEVATKAARLAARFAAKHGWDVVLLHVLERPPMPSFAFPDSVKAEAIHDLERDAQCILKDAERSFSAMGVTATSKLVHGSAAESILEEVSSGGYGILVLGSTGLGRGKLGSLLLGSVAERVIRGVQVPVLLVKEDTEVD